MTLEAPSAVRRVDPHGAGFYINRFHAVAIQHAPPQSRDRDSGPPSLIAEQVSPALVPLELPSGLPTSNCDDDGETKLPRSAEERDRMTQRIDFLSRNRDAIAATSTQSTTPAHSGAPGGTS